MQDTLFYLTHFLDRKGLERGNGNWHKKIIEDPAARFIPVWERKNLFTKGTDIPLFLEKHQIGSPEEAIFLGSTEKVHYLAVLIDDPSELSLEVNVKTEWARLRSKAEGIPYEENSLLAFAAYLSNWHASAQYSGRSGYKTVPTKGGFARMSLNPDKAYEEFPRTDPAMIVLVEHEGRCLLGRKANWAAGRYSVLAGFVEAMESVEETIKREVYEETNINVISTTYFSSQPWPFPASLMLGYRAQASNKDIILHDGELEDARWFSREVFAKELLSGKLKLPSFTSISHHLIKQWYEEGGDSFAGLLERAPE
ncbi:MAG: NAD(+) diphosphatase [Bacteroidota bacterium]